MNYDPHSHHCSLRMVLEKATQERWMGREEEKISVGRLHT